MKQITILVAAGLYPPQIGGPATYARMLETVLPQHDIAVVTIPFSAVHHKRKVFKHFAYMRLLYRAAKKADIIYALDPISVGVPAYVVSVLRRKPFLLRLGGDYAWEQGVQRFGLTQNLDEYTGNRKHAPFLVKAFAFLQGFIARRARMVIAPSEYLKKIIASWGVHENRIKVIYSALFPLEVEDSKTELRSELGFEGKVIATAGRLVPWKGFSELIDVFAQAQKDIPDLFLVIIGDGPLEGELKQKVEDLVLERKIRFMGNLSKGDLGKAIKASDLFVLNTSYEGLSHQLLEAMDLGVPVIATNVGGNLELIVDEISGLLVPVGDPQALRGAIERVFEHESLRTRLSQNARVRTRDFSQDAVIAELLALLHETIK